MPDGNAHGGSRVADLFRARMAQRAGELADVDPELASFGESLGVPSLPGGTGAVQPAMPGKPVTAPAGPEVPAGDSLASMSPPGEGMTPSRPTQEEPAAGSPEPQKMGIPALDALSEMPKKRHRGLVHDRKLGRVLKMGS